MRGSSEWRLLTAALSGSSALLEWWIMNERITGAFRKSGGGVVAVELIEKLLTLET